MKLFASTFAAVALFAAFGQAAPLESKNVAADAKWVVHVDVDAVRASQIVQKAFATCPILKDSGKHFDMIRDKAGIDLRSDLHGITLYGPDTDKTHGVAIVFSTVNQKLLLEKAAKAPEHKVTKHGEVEIHSWTQKCGKETHTAVGAFYKPDVMVFGACPICVGKAIDVLDGKSPAVATGRDSLIGRGVRPGTIFLARATAIPAETKCAVLKQMESFRVALGENDGKSFYSATLVMKSPEAAEQIKTINEGFKAMGTLKFSGEADVMKLIDGFKTTVQEKTVRVTWTASTDDVWTVAEKAYKKAAEHMKKMKEHMQKSGEHAKKPAEKQKKTSADDKGGCPAGCQCPACKAKAEAGKLKKTSADAKGGCPAGCQCPACKAKAEAKAKKL